MEVKQVIVIRKDLNMWKGKMIAQGAHASIRAMFSATGIEFGESQIFFSDVEYINKWINGLQTKLCVSVDSEQELIDVYKQALKTDLPCALIKDAGLTEFKEPTYTAVAIGPGPSEEIDKITGKLKLL